MENASGEPSTPKADPSPPAQGKPRVWTPFVLVVLSLIAAIGWQVLLAVSLVVPHITPGVNPAQLQQKIIEELATPMMVILFSVGGQVAFGAGALVAARLSPEPLRNRLGLLPVSTSRSIYPLAMLGSLVPLGIGLGLAEALALVVPPDPTVKLMYDKMTLAASVPFVLYIALAPGFCEELMFRGYLQRRLLQRWSPARAIWVTSIVFALMHITPHAIVATLPIGLWIGVVAWRAGSIYPGILCHAFINGSVNAWRVTVKFAGIPEVVQTVVVATSLLIGLICFVILVRTLWQDGAESVDAESLRTTPDGIRRSPDPGSE